MRSADTNLFLYAANPASPYHHSARSFFAKCAADDVEFAICELVLVEIYMQLRNPAVLNKPLSSSEAVSFCRGLKSHPRWQTIDYVSDVSLDLWRWAATTTTGFRSIIDARLALTLRHHGVTELATANTRHFLNFGFDRVWNPINDSAP